MIYFIEVPFGSVDSKESEDRATLISDDLLRIKGVTFMRISARQFERITKSFREKGWTYQVTGVGDSAEGDNPEALSTLLMRGHPQFPGLIYSPQRESA